MINTDTRRLPIEIERKYLLKALPMMVKQVEVDATRLAFEQGYLPGTLIKERVSKRGNGTFSRTVKYGSGLSRWEFQEDIDIATFYAFWPLTLGRRIHKERWRVTVKSPLRIATRVWEIDRFLDRELFLAEIELPHADTKVEIPEWLAPLVIEDVTDNPKWEGFNLGL